MDGLIAVGRPLENWTPQAEGVSFEPTYGGQPFVFLAYDRPTPIESKLFQSAKLWLGLYKASVHTSFLLVGVPGLLPPEGYGDAPFTACVSASAAMEVTDERAGFVFTLILADNKTGVVHELRTATVSPEFSQVLAGLHAEQRTSTVTFSVERHRAEIEETYRRFPTPGAMVRECLIVEPIGVPFAEARERRLGTMFRSKAGS